MASQLYIQAKQKFLDGDLSWRDDIIHVLLVDLADYTPNLVTDEFLADIPLAARVATSEELSGKTSLMGVADADDVLFNAVTGDVSEALVVFRETGDPATSELIAFIDTATNLPITPDGSDILVQWDAAGVFAL